MRWRGRASGTSSTSPMRGRRAVGHHHDAVGQQHRLVDVVGDHDHRCCRAGRGSPSPRPADARGSARRARRTARRAAGSSAPWPARGRCRRAASCRRRSRPGACPWRAPSAPGRDCASSSRGARPCVLVPREHLVDGQVDVLVDGQPGQQRMVLEHHGAVRPGLVDLLVLEQHGAGRHLRSGRRRC